MRAKSAGNKEIRYLYGNRNRTERDRLRQLERLEDPNSIELLQNLGVTNGWHCLEIGASGLSVQGTAYHDRLVKGGSTEAMYQQLTIKQLAQSIRAA